MAVHLGPEEMNIRMKTTYSMEIASARKDTQTIEEILLKHCHPYQDVFEKQVFDELPPGRPWDHAVESVKGAKALDCKIYPLSKEEQTQLEEFLKENFGNKLNQAQQKSNGEPLLLCKEKRWEVKTGTRLSEAE